jgi:tripeptidyl-peptidase-1
MELSLKVYCSVTSVGATKGVPEVGMFDARLNLSPTGGFSNYFPVPDYQSSVVGDYVSNLGDTYSGLYNASGRGFPDVSAYGQNVGIFLAGKHSQEDGTSAATPMFASVVALLNDQLLAAGKPPLGFLNPWLYANPGALNDIVDGTNPGCGTDGFSAGTGWDPLTGLGTPNFAALLAAAGLGSS